MWWSRPWLVEDNGGIIWDHELIYWGKKIPLETNIFGLERCDASSQSKRMRQVEKWDTVRFQFSQNLKRWCSMFKLKKSKNRKFEMVCFWISEKLKSWKVRKWISEKFESSRNEGQLECFGRCLKYWHPKHLELSGRPCIFLVGTWHVLWGNVQWIWLIYIPWELISGIS